MLSSVNSNKKKTYVGYTNNIENRLKKHNSNKGAKATRGYKWKVIYLKKFLSKSEAMRHEYKLKKNKKERLLIFQLKTKKND
tara:strand:- start:1601 stop:1846 length:246 start_codon:yes stop_codon:yes gene_type:complete